METQDWTVAEPDTINAFPTRERMLPWQAEGLTWTATGYGAKIPSTRQAFVAGRWRRIYVAVYSNSGTAYVMVKGERRIVRDYQLVTN